MFFFFKQKTAYEMRISDWSSDVCSSDLLHRAQAADHVHRRSPLLITDLVRRDRLLLYALGLEALDHAVDRPGFDAADHDHQHHHDEGERSEERRVGKECVSTLRSRWAPDH